MTLRACASALLAGFLALTTLAPATGLAAAMAIPGDQSLNAEQVVADLDLAEKAFSRVHPGYARYAAPDTLAGAWESLRERARGEDGMSVSALYLGVSRVLPLIRCDHTKAELPKALREGRSGAPLYLPLRWQWIEGRALVRYAPADSAVAAGDELLAIDGVAVATRVEETAALVPVDGYTDHAKAGEMGVSLEFMGGAVEHFGALLQPPPAEATLTVRAPNAPERIVRVTRVDHSAWSALGAQAGRARNFKDAITFERLGERAAYLSVDTFVNYREPVDPHSLYAPVFQALKDEGRDTLILDLRRNGGGSSDASHGLLAYLIDRPLRMHTDMRVATLDLDDLREHLSTWDKRALNPNRLGFRKQDDGTYSLRSFVSDDLKRIKPRRQAFEGRLLVLISADNSSGSTNLSAILAEQDRTTLIGEETGGSAEGPTAGLLFTLTLPNSGIRMRLPFFRYRNDVSGFERGMGLSPDIEAPWTFESARAGEDPAMEAALALIER
ncbi:MAG: S41 family peptidase [Pseudomonadota bacterium]